MAKTKLSTKRSTARAHHKKSHSRSRSRSPHRHHKKTHSRSRSRSPHHHHHSHKRSSPRAAKAGLRQHTKKYTTRPSPPFPANQMCGMVKKGNDGAMWISSKVGKQRACTWKHVVKKAK